MIFLFLSVSACHIPVFLQLPDDAGFSRSVRQYRKSLQGAPHFHPQGRRHRHHRRPCRHRQLQRVYRVQVQNSLRLQQAGEKRSLGLRGV